VAVPFKIPFLEKADGKRQNFLDWKKLMVDLQKTKVDQNIDLLKTSLLPECRRHYPCSDFLFMQDSVTSDRGRVTTVSMTELSRLHSCCWMGIIVSTSESFRLLHLRHPAGFGVRRPTTSVCKSTGPERGNQKQMEGGHHWDTIAQWKNDWMWLETRM